ncbi:hypothetical protein GCM10025875_16480 [Litorihabitans aurantiacus]|uniref:Tyrosine--tRNA ligase n=1 Tax=Litorihabitans aurantiacus TaxID=1930061 RepID=A0AA37XED0_9MICO|nr:hypothetical protein GCM10025875_16480 [Litorihabitans aurantiacus]
MVAGWVDRLRAQIEPFLAFDGENAARMVNNLDWTAELSAIDLLRDIGKHFRMGTMLAKDVVARRLASDEGISFTEFSYQLLQGNDYLELHRRHGVTLQTGGSDQWGNLLSGVELIRKAEGRAVHAWATPLITKADGTKFGKTEGGAVWLAADMMSPYAFYQYWVNASDADAVRWLRTFTFRTREEIEAIERATAERPQAREAQRTLAADVTTLVHGAGATAAVEAASAALFGRGARRARRPDARRRGGRARQRTARGGGDHGARRAGGDRPGEGAQRGPTGDHRGRRLRQQRQAGRRRPRAR